MEGDRRIDDHWARFLGVAPEALRSPGVVVTRHSGLGDSHGIWFFVRHRSAVVSAPAPWVARLEASVGSAAAEELCEPGRVARIVGRREIVGPSYQGWLPPEQFRPVDSQGVRLLLDSEAACALELRAACARMEWEHGGIDLAAGEVWADFEGSKAVALAQLRTRPGLTPDPCVITHPENRGEGDARRVVSAIIQPAVAEGRLVLYQTLLENAASCAVARRLGFRHYATLVAARLPEDAG